MATSAPNLVNLQLVSKAYGVRPLLTTVSLGVQQGDRVGVVGRNGDGKTTLLRILAGRELPDHGRVTHTGGLRLALLSQHDDLEPTATVASAVLGDRAEHEWAGDARARDVVDHLLAGLDLRRTVTALSGGERRRVALAALLLDESDLLLLDEPTNHLDVEVVDWLARHLRERRVTFVVVTHDRWFLDAVCTTTWEVHDARVDSFDGGYAAYVLAKAERARQAAATETRRNNLMRKELAWLRRGAPARTSKPKFRLEAASTLVDSEPDPRDRVELQRFAVGRLGKDVLDLEDASIVRGGRHLVDRLTWRIGAGERLGLIGVNGTGKTSVLSVLAERAAPDAGRLRTGRTVRRGYLTQALDDLQPTQPVLAAVEEVRRVASVDGRDLSATSMLERFGFTGDRLTARVGDLSGGERRRLQLLRLLLDEPNVLLLDEPTNDLDIETLTVVEDFLDSWAGTLVVVSHDRYFLERVCDVVWALLGDGRLVLLPGGVDEYLARRAAADDSRSADSSVVRQTDATPPSDAATQRAAGKLAARLDRQLSTLAARVDAVHAEMSEHASDYARLAELDERLRALQEEQDAVETAWLEAAEDAASR